MKTQELKNKGFTIIEVVLVLAIAALILLMVFLAWPALQRNQRDTQRRNDIGRFTSQLSQYATNNNGNIPNNTDKLASFVSTYLVNASTGETFNDPRTGEPYNVKAVAAGTAINDGEVQYRAKATCSGEEIVDAPGTRQAAVRIKLESSGIFCQSYN